jgi:subtilisin family serine protease
MNNRSRYVRMSGTSMATPYVTGIAALYAAADPTLQGEALRSRIVADALSLNWPADRVGAGLARYV